MVPMMEHVQGAPYHFNNLMSQHHFDSLVAALQYMDQPMPAFLDHFFHTCQLIEAWNHHMANKFSPSWVNCLDESMSM